MAGPDHEGESGVGAWAGLKVVVGLNSTGEGLWLKHSKLLVWGMPSITREEPSLLEYSCLLQMEYLCLLQVEYPCLLQVEYPCLLQVENLCLLQVEYLCLLQMEYPCLLQVEYPRLLQVEYPCLLQVEYLCTLQVEHLQLNHLRLLEDHLRHLNVRIKCYTTTLLYCPEQVHIDAYTSSTRGGRLH